FNLKFKKFLFVLLFLESKKAIDDDVPQIAMQKLRHNKMINLAKLRAKEREVQQENERLLTRISKAKGMYSAKKWAREYESNRYLAAHIARLPRPVNINPPVEVFHKIRLPTPPRTTSRRTTIMTEPSTLTELNTPRKAPSIKKSRPTPRATPQKS